MVTAVADIDIDQLAGLKRKQIQSLCKKHGIRANGKTEELVEHLIAYAKDGSKPNEPAAEQEENEEEEQDKDSTETPEEEPTVPEPEQPAEDAAPCLAEDHNGEAVEEVAEEAVEESIEEATEDATEEVVKEVVEEAAEETIEEATEEAAEVTVEETADEPAEEATQETTKETTKDVNGTSSLPIADEPKDAEHKDSSTADIVPMTPKGSGNTKTAPKTLAFDRIHQNMFNSGDSIANHWSVKRAATPKAKRVDGDDEVPASNKRARIEPLFTSPGPKPQHPALRDSSSASTSTSNVPEATELPADQQDTSTTSTSETDIPAVINESEEEKPASTDSTTLSSSSKTDDASQSLIQKPTVSKSSIEKRLSETTSFPSRIPPPRKSDQPAATNPANDSKTEAKPASTSSAANPRVVESKIKAYINAKPPSPKVKAVKHKVVDPKQPPKAAPTTKPAAAALPTDTRKKPKSSAADNDGIPSYMRPTRATESRAQAHKPVSAKAPVKGGEENSSHNGNGRFKPYSRPSNPPAKKADTDKSAMPKSALPSAK
ncbi:hypothetical protein LPJ53_003859 [Coemansia erecta]|uniref:SAP domain-containing protein n=1 Tax=Coemansia erecta TaxID=147472 RepID=A0A9W7XZS6_9FUNG|nr:hypothetical protein LPJ53_003859 [Coemansia erecta]